MILAFEEIGAEKGDMTGKPRWCTQPLEGNILLAEIQENSDITQNL